MGEHLVMVRLDGLLVLLGPAHHEAAVPGEGEASATEATTTEHATEAAAEAGHASPVQGAIHIGDNNTVIHQAHEAPAWVKVSPFVAMVLGLGLAWLFYIRSPHLPGQLARQQAHIAVYKALGGGWVAER